MRLQSSCQVGLQSSQGSAEAGGSVSKLSHMFVSRSQFLAIGQKLWFLTMWDSIYTAYIGQLADSTVRNESFQLESFHTYP